MGTTRLANQSYNFMQLLARAQLPLTTFFPHPNIGNIMINTMIKTTAESQLLLQGILKDEQNANQYVRIDIDVRSLSEAENADCSRICFELNVAQ